MARSIWIDNDVCMSSGRCVADLPKVFRFDDDELAELVPQAALTVDTDVLVAAVRNCPAGAIHLSEDGREIEA